MLSALKFQIAPVLLLQIYVCFAACYTLRERNNRSGADKYRICVIYYPIAIGHFCEKQ